MPTVEETLRQSGFTDEQIAGMDQRAITVFSGVLSDANKAREEAKAAQDAAELAQRSNIDFYDNRIAPSLVAWEEEKQQIENRNANRAAELAFYRTQAEEAKKAGFIPADAPGFIPPQNPTNGGQPRDPQGRYVPNVPGTTPGSPTFDMGKLYERAADGMNIIADIEWEHRRLYDNRPLPMSPSELLRQADALKMDPKSFAERQFNFGARRHELAAQEEKAKADKIAAEATAPLQQQIKEQEERHKKEVADINRGWAERTGNNPDVKRPQENPRMTEIAKGVRENPKLDPLSMNENERRALTRQMIRSDIEANSAA